MIKINNKGQTLLGRMIIFFIVFGIVSLIFYYGLGDMPGKNIIALFVGLFAGFIVSGGGYFIWRHRTSS